MALFAAILALQHRFTESTMKLFASRFLALLLKFSAALAACIGCTAKHDEAPKPRQIRWRGPETGYTCTTVIEPDNPGTTKEPQ